MRRAVRWVVVGIGLIAVASAPRLPAQSASPAIYMSEADLMATLKEAAKSAPAQGAIAHPEGTEVHHIVDGSATLVTGGTIVGPTAACGRGSSGATIDGGVSRHVAKGDVILIPASTPHWYTDLDGTITYLEVRFDLPKP